METVEMMKKKKPWETLPSLALLNIFRNLNFKDRFGSIPLVCKEWNSVISNDPRCWSSMIPDSISPDDAFIKKPVYSIQVNTWSKLYDCEGGQEVKRDQGVSYLRNFINKSSSCSSSSGSSGESSNSNSTNITSLFLDPFNFSYPNTNKTSHQDEILHLIARCCPNLKHISFDGFYCASTEAVLEVFHTCKKIELIDFSVSGYANSVQVIEVLGKCLPNLRGIRMAGWKKYSIHDAIAKHLPRIKLLALDFKSSYDYGFRKLTSETECCLYELQYLSVGLWEIKEEPPVCTHIPEFHYEKLMGYGCVQPLRSVHQPTPVCYHCVHEKQEEEKAKAILVKAREEAREEAEEDYLECSENHEDFYYEDYSVMKQKKKDYLECSENHEDFYYEDYSVMKQKKKYEYDGSISKEKKKRKKTRRNHSYLVLRTRMRKNKIMYNNSFNIDENDTDFLVNK